MTERSAPATAQAAIDPETEGLIDLYQRTTLLDYLAEAWARRAFAIRVPLRALRARNLNNVLGLLWFLLNPILLVLVYYVFFGLVLDTSRRVPNFITYLAIGVFTFTFMQRTATQASRSLTMNLGLIKAIRFPRILLPIASTVEQLFSHLPVVVVMIVVALATGETPSLKWLLLFPLVLAQAAFAFSLGLFLARVTDHFPDIQNFLPFAFRLLLYGSGVLYSVDAYVDSSTARHLFYLNPFYDSITLMRWAIFGTGKVAFPLAGIAIAQCIALPVGLYFFRKGEPYGRT